ncbi:hypothetical protein D3C73_1075000 [compost metagenome]
MAVGYAGNLDVPDAGHVAFQLHGDIAFDDLAVIAIELHFQVGRANLGADRLGLVLAVQKEAGDVARVDGFDHHRDTRRGGDAGGARQVPHIHRAMRRAILIRANQARHHVQTAVAQLRRVGQRLIQAAQELVFTARQRCNAAFAGRPVAGRRVEQGLRQAVVLQPRTDVSGGEVVGEQKLHPLEPVAGGGLEAVQEGVLVVHHGQVGGQARHGGSLSIGVAWASAFNG